METGKKKIGLYLFFTFILTALVVGGGVYAWMRIQQEQEDEQEIVEDEAEEDATEEADEVENEEADEEEMEDEEDADTDEEENADSDEDEEDEEESVAEIFYTKYEPNIFVYDVESGTVTQLTNYPDPEATPSYDADGNEIARASIGNISVLDESTIGFGKCATVTGDFGCGLYTLDRTTGVETELERFSADTFLILSAIYSPTRYAYLYEADSEWHLVYTNTGSDTELKLYDAAAYGRGGFVEDSAKLLFSPDGSHLFHVSTGAPPTGMDFNVYVYALASGDETVIANATQPAWLDADRIVYRSYNNAAGTGDGLHVYTMSTSTDTKLAGIADGAYNPAPRGDTIIYERPDIKQLWQYNLATNTASLFLDEALGALWATDAYVIYEAIGVCLPGDAMCGGMVDYEVEEVVVYDVAAGDSSGTISNAVSTWGMAAR